HTSLFSSCLVLGKRGRSSRLRSTFVSCCRVLRRKDLIRMCEGDCQTLGYYIVCIHVENEAARVPVQKRVTAKSSARLAIASPSTWGAFGGPMNHLSGTSSHGSCS